MNLVPHPEIKNADKTAWLIRERNFGRQSLKGAAILSGMAAAYGAFVVGPPVLTPVEFWSALAFIPLAIAAFLYVQFRPDRAVQNLGYPVTILAGLYIVINSWAAALLAESPAHIIVHLAWTTPLAIFAFILLPRTHAMAASISISALQTFAVIALHQRFPDVEYEIIFVVQMIWILVQAVCITLVFGVTRLIDVNQAERLSMSVKLEQVEQERLRLTQLKEQKDRYKRLITYSLDVVAEINPDGTLLDISKNCRELTGYTRDELLNKNLADFITPQTLERVLEAFNSVLAGQPSNTIEVHLQGKNGTAVPILVSAVFSPDDNILFVVARDLRDRIAQEERERHASRLEALGQLTGGIAHDFNNLLTVMFGEVERLEEVFEQRNLSDIDLSRLQRAADGAFDLTGRLLAFSRKEPLHLARTNLKSTLENSMGLLSSTIGANFSLSCHAEDVWACIDAPELQAAIINLTVNARDAMPNGGKIELQTGPIQLDTPLQFPWGQIKVGNYAFIKVVDHGCGIPNDVLPKVVEPYFTTKGLGMGTGLGVSMAMQLVEKLGGGLGIESAPNQGTTVTLFIPQDNNAA
tara:strand:- start:136794 stop:138536 length:1743 start_codon:yes stop_codon:yes gene_type:complete